MTGGSCRGSGEAQTTSYSPENMHEAFRTVSKGLESIATKGMDLPVEFGRGRGDQFTFGHAVSMAITGYLLAPGLGEDLFAIHLGVSKPLGIPGLGRRKPASLGQRRRPQGAERPGCLRLQRPGPDRRLPGLVVWRGRRPAGSLAG